MTQRYIHDVSANISGIAQGVELGSVLFTLHISEIAKTVEGCISDLSDLEKMDQKSGKAAGKEGGMGDHQKMGSDDDEKIKGIELGGCSSMKTNVGEDAEDWIDAFARSETNGCISDLSPDISGIRQDIIRNFFDSSDDDDEKIRGMGLGRSSSMKTNAGEVVEDWIDAFARPETNGSISDLPPDISGIRQGTELGSVLFILLISEIAKPRCQICESEITSQKSMSIHQKMDDWEIANGGLNVKIVSCFLRRIMV